MINAFRVGSPNSFSPRRIKATINYQKPFHGRIHQPEQLYRISFGRQTACITTVCIQPIVCLNHSLLHEKRYSSHKKSGTKCNPHTVAFPPDTDEKSASQGHHVDGQKAFGHSFSHAYQYHHGQHTNGAALQAEKCGQSGGMGLHLDPPEPIVWLQK
jgi:hypothetical protein